MSRRQIKLGLSMRQLGYHAGGWRHPDVPADGAMRIEHFARIARKAEHGLFDMVFLADGLALRQRDNPQGSLCRTDRNVELEPLTLLSALAMVTRDIGLVATASTSYNEPFHVARKYASLDHISGGRAGWNIVTSWSEEEARNFNREKHFEYDERYERAAEFVEVAKGLWDSWDEDAFLRDKDAGVFFDPGKMHVLNHSGKHFSVRGPLTVARPVQGYPVLVQAGSSEAGQEIAARNADVCFVAHTDLGDAQDYYRSVKGKLAKYGRHEDELKVLPGLLAIVAPTEAEARDKYEELQQLIHPLVGLAHVYGPMGDLSAHPIDGPVPQPNDPQHRSRAKVLLDLAARNNWTIRDLYLAVSMGRGHRTLIGTAVQVADAMEEWVDGRGADGFNIIPATLPGGIDDFVEHVIPELQNRGIYRTAYEGRTFRENLGVPYPRSSHAK